MGMLSVQTLNLGVGHGQIPVLGFLVQYPHRLVRSIHTINPVPFNIHVWVILGVGQILEPYRGRLYHPMYLGYSTTTYNDN